MAPTSTLRPAYGPAERRALRGADDAPGTLRETLRGTARRALHPMARQASHDMTFLTGATHVGVIPAEAEALSRRPGALLPPGLTARPQRRSGPGPLRASVVAAVQGGIRVAH